MCHAGKWCLEGLGLQRGLCYGGSVFPGWVVCGVCLYSSMFVLSCVSKGRNLLAFGGVPGAILEIRLNSVRKFCVCNMRTKSFTSSVSVQFDNPFISRDGLSAFCLELYQ